jgi:hypothetical protein
MHGRRQKYASTALVLEPLRSRTRGIADGLPLPFPLLIKTGSQRPARTRGGVVPVLDLLAQPASRARRNKIQKNPVRMSKPSDPIEVRQQSDGPKEQHNCEATGTSLRFGHLTHKKVATTTFMATSTRVRRNVDIRRRLR